MVVWNYSAKIVHVAGCVDTLSHIIISIQQILYAYMRVHEQLDTASV